MKRYELEDISYGVVESPTGPYCSVEEVRPLLEEALNALVDARRGQFRAKSVYRAMEKLRAFLA